MYLVVPYKNEYSDELFDNASVGGEAKLCDIPYSVRFTPNCNESVYMFCVSTLFDALRLARYAKRGSSPLYDDTESEDIDNRIAETAEILHSRIYREKDQENKI